MAIYTEFKFELEKDKVLSTINCYDNSPVYDKVSKIYYKLEEKLRTEVKPFCIYEKTKEMYCNKKKITTECHRGYYYTLISLGSKIEELIDDCFQRGEYLEGTLLNAMCDYFLFIVSNQFVRYLKSICKKDDLYLVKRLSPGDEIDFSIVKTIVDLLDRYNQFPCEIKVNEAFAVSPIKTMTNIYILSNEKKDDLLGCKKCNINCLFGRAFEDESIYESTI